MQQQLDNLYLNYLEKIFLDKELEDNIENEDVSAPHLLDIERPNSNWLNSEYKVLFIGKETNGWNPKDRQKEGLLPINGQFQKYIVSLKNVYKSLNYTSSIYLFMDILIEKLSEKRKTGFLLTNLLRHDYCQSSLPYELALKVTYDNNYILRKEIEILNPDALVLLSGPHYDRYIEQHTYPMAHFKEFDNYPLNQVKIYENIPNIKKAIRIYHPDAHKYQGAEYRYDMADIICKFLN